MQKWCNPVESCSVHSYPAPPWHISNPFLNQYTLKEDSETIHTGDDVNLNHGADIGAIVRSITDGEVIFAEFLEDSSWLGLVVIRHDFDGTFVCSRYGHLDRPLSVKVGDIVVAGAEIGKIVDTDKFASAPFKPHLHFDIIKEGDNILIDNPRQWPSEGTLEERRTFIKQHYQNPTKFMSDRLALMTEPEGSSPTSPLIDATETRLITANPFLNIREEPTTQSATVGQLLPGTTVEVLKGKSISANGFNWIQLADKQGWIASEFTQLHQPKLGSRGVNIDLNLPETSPDDLSDFAYCRFVFDLSRDSGNTKLDHPGVIGFEAKIRGYIDQGVTPIVVLNHEFFGEGAGFVWEQMRDDTPEVLQKWSNLTDQFVVHLAKLVNIYHDSIVYEIWNESDAGSVAAVQIPERAFANLLDKSLETIHGIALNAQVIVGGLVSGHPEYWQKTHDAMHNVSQLAGVGIHPYGRGPNGPPTKFEHFGSLKQLIDGYAAISTVDVFWLTEWGVLNPDASSSNPPNESESDVADYIRRFLNSAENDARIKSTVFFALRDHMHNAYGLIRGDNTHKDLVWDAMTTA